LVPEARDIGWTLLPIIFQWRWNFDFVFVAFRVERIHLRELKLETTKVADIPRSVVVRELFVTGCFARLCEINGADDGVLVPSFVINEARFQGGYLLHTNYLFLFRLVLRSDQVDRFLSSQIPKVNLEIRCDNSTFVTVA